MQASNSEKLVTLIGGSGFIGRHVVRALAKRGYRVRVACRRPDLAGHVVPLGVPGQIVPMQANVRFPNSLAAACEGAYAVVNLTGVLYNAGAQTFDALHVFGAEAVAKAAKASGADVYIHMSALGASEDSTSLYARTKAAGEVKARAQFANAAILRPSIVFGPEDEFFNRFAKMARFSPVLPLIGGETKFQPVFVGDVAEAIARLIDNGAAVAKTYELGGPEVKSFRNLLDYVLSVTMRKRLLLPIPFGIAKYLGAILGHLPKPALTSDHVELLKSDNVVSGLAQKENRSLNGLGIAPRKIDDIVPTYLYRFRKAGQFTVPKAKPE